MIWHDMIWHDVTWHDIKWCDILWHERWHRCREEETKFNEEVHSSFLTPHAACPNLFASVPAGASVILGVITPEREIKTIQKRTVTLCPTFFPLTWSVRELRLYESELSIGLTYEFSNWPGLGYLCLLKVGHDHNVSDCVIIRAVRLHPYIS